MMIVALSLITNCAMAAAAGYGAPQGCSCFDSFRMAHPLLMVLLNIGGIFLLIGICASICAACSKSPWDK